MILFLHHLCACFWLPYALCFRHRHILSHLPVIGTMTRVLYVGVPLLLAAWRLGIDFAAVPRWAERVALGAIVGVAVAEAGHAVADCWRDVGRAVAVAALVAAAVWAASRV